MPAIRLFNAQVKPETKKSKAATEGVIHVLDDFDAGNERYIRPSKRSRLGEGHGEESGLPDGEESDGEDGQEDHHDVAIDIMFPDYHHFADSDGEECGQGATEHAMEEAVISVGQVCHVYEPHLCRSNDFSVVFP
jgi:hypothetical protein